MDILWLEGIADPEVVKAMEERIEILILTLFSLPETWKNISQGNWIPHFP